MRKNPQLPYISGERATCRHLRGNKLEQGYIPGHSYRIYEANLEILKERPRLACWLSEIVVVFVSG